MRTRRFAAMRHSSSYRALCALLIVSMALPVHATAGQEQPGAACREEPRFLETRAVSTDAEFVRAAAGLNLRPVGAEVTSLDDGATVVTSVAARPFGANRPEVMYFRRDAVYEPGQTVPGMLTDLRLGKDPGRDVLWAKITFSLPGDSERQAAIVEYAVEYQASEVPGLDGLGGGESPMLKEWSANAQPLEEYATVSYGGLQVAVEMGKGSLERAVESLVKSSSRTRCREGCRRYLGSGNFSIACVIAGVLGCTAVCIRTFGRSCYPCLNGIMPTCRYLGSVVSLYNYLKCYVRC